MTVSAATVQREVLHPVMEAIALEDRQSALIANLTEERDCILDHANAIAARPHDAEAVLEHVAAIIGYCPRAIATGQLQVHELRRPAGFSDEWVRILTDGERNGDSTVVGVKALARTLRPALRILASPSAVTPREFVAAVRTVDDLIRRLPRAQLTARAVEHELGSGPFGVLVAHLESYERGARVDGPSPAVDRGQFGDAHES